MSANYSKEDALLLTASRCRPSAAALARVRELADSADWDRVAAVANTHLVLPLVLANLTAANAQIPESFLSEWRELPAMTTRDNLRLLSQLDRLLQVFAAKGIPVLTWKGPVLTASAYGSLAARHSCDLDLLVPPERMADARDALLANGYTLEKSAHGWLVPAVWHEFVFLPAGAGHGTVEVHPLIGIWCQVAQPATADLMARAITVDVAGRTVPTLSNEDMLIAVVLHGAQHYWMRLRHIADIDACAHAGMDWDLVMARARQIGIERLMRVALMLAHQLLESPVPERIIDAS